MSSFVEKYGKKAPARTAESLTKKPPVAEKKNAIQDMATKKQTSSVDSTKSSNADLIYLVKGIDDNRNAWYYVLVDRLKVSLFLKALNDDIIHLENYGKILHSAYGDEPPKEITQRVKAEFGLNDI